MCFVLHLRRSVWQCPVGDRRTLRPLRPGRSALVALLDDGPLSLRCLGTYTCTTHTNSVADTGNYASTAYTVYTAYTAYTAHAVDFMCVVLRLRRSGWQPPLGDRRALRPLRPGRAALVAVLDDGPLPVQGLPTPASKLPRAIEPLEDQT